MGDLHPGGEPGHLPAEEGDRPGPWRLGRLLGLGRGRSRWWRSREAAPDGSPRLIDYVSGEKSVSSSLRHYHLPGPKTHKDMIFNDYGEEKRENKKKTE